MDSDEWCDHEIATELERSVTGAEIFSYPGSGHLFTDSSVADHEPAAATLAIERAVEFFDRSDAR